jgi:hypothetical protein
MVSNGPTTLVVVAVLSVIVVVVEVTGSRVVGTVTVFVPVVTVVETTVVPEGDTKQEHALLTRLGG